MKILTCHQPNFLPYMGYFYKLWKSDVYSVSDTCQFTTDKNNGMHNYNYINEFGHKNRLSIPVDKRHGQLSEVLIHPEYDRLFKEKNAKRIWYAYHNALHFNEVWADIEPILLDMKSGDSLSKRNIQFTKLICDKIGINIPFFLESSYKDLPSTPDEAIIFMCKKTGCDAYMVGVHGCQYMDYAKYERNGITLVQSDFDDKKDPTGNKLSVLDYLMNNGYKIPKEWE